MLVARSRKPSGRFATLARLVLRGHEDRVIFAAFSFDGARIVTASDDKTARLCQIGNLPLFPNRSSPVYRGRRDSFNEPFAAVVELPDFLLADSDNRDPALMAVSRRQ